MRNPEGFSLLAKLVWVAAGLLLLRALAAGIYFVRERTAAQRGQQGTIAPARARTRPAPIR